MSRRRPRGLRPDEAELWARVAHSLTPLHAALPPSLMPDDAAPETPQGEAPQGGKASPPAPAPRFRLGQTATPRLPGHDLAPALADRLAAQPVRMDRKAHHRLKRGKLTPEARLDLHGMTLAEAHPQLIGFVLRSHAAGRRLILVITGKGRSAKDEGPIPRRRGILRHQVPQWLTSAPLGGAVLQITPAHVRHGGEGALYVYLRRNPASLDK